MSTIDDIKNKTREKKTTAAEYLTKDQTEENNDGRNEEIKEGTKVERKRVSFDLRTDLHRELKLQSIVQDKNIYVLIEEALEKHLKE